MAVINDELLRAVVANHGSITSKEAMGRLCEQHPDIAAFVGKRWDALGDCRYDFARLVALVSEAFEQTGGPRLDPSCEEIEQCTQLFFEGLWESDAVAAVLDRLHDIEPSLGAFLAFFVKHAGGCCDREAIGTCCSAYGGLVLAFAAAARVDRYVSQAPPPTVH